MKKFLSTKEVAEYLGVNEKMIYTLIAEKGLPASKVTGKWIFPLPLVDQWIETNTLNYPEATHDLPSYEGLLIIAGSNDLLLEKTISLFNKKYPEDIAVFGNLGSMGGLRALRQNLCHVASSHLLSDNKDEYNFDFADREFNKMPVIVNFCRREQGILIQKGNPKKIHSFKNIGKPGIQVVNRSVGTGTRLLFDSELKKAGLKGDALNGYHNTVNSHMDVGLEILAGKADAGPGIRPVAALLDLNFVPLRCERYDLLITKEHFFDKGVQYFIEMLQESEFKQLAASFEGYDVSSSGKIIFPKENIPAE
ncbi:MAG: substrate-binding domain-containing protein [Dissulfuribacterales bacterium]